MRIAIVNDLSIAREVLKRVVESVPGYAVAWMAQDGAEAVRKTAGDVPDVILMDLIMPVMDGVEATRRIMAENPCPILLVTATVQGNIGKVYEAMGHGGLDAVMTPVLGPNGTILESQGLVSRLAKLAQAKQLAQGKERLTKSDGQPAPSRSVSTLAGDLPPLVAVGASTGGPEALAQVLGALPRTFPGCVILVQHIDADFGASLGTWLQARSALPVTLAQAGSRPRAGTVLLAGSNDHLILRPDASLVYTPEPADYPYRPSVNALFESLAEHWPQPGVAALLTGMGTDGARGLLHLRQAGWWTLAQDQKTCVVYGMPRAAAESNAACQISPLKEIGPAVLAHLPVLPQIQPNVSKKKHA